MWGGGNDGLLFETRILETWNRMARMGVFFLTWSFGLQEMILKHNKMVFETFSSLLYPIIYWLLYPFCFYRKRFETRLSTLLCVSWFGCALLVAFLDARMFLLLFDPWHNCRDQNSSVNSISCGFHVHPKSLIDSKLHSALPSFSRKDGFLSITFVTVSLPPYYLLLIPFSNDQITTMTTTTENELNCN